MKRLLSLKGLSLLICALSFLSWQIYENWPELVVVKGANPRENVFILMPRQDKKRLEFFFRETCLSDVWAYTLVGSKPMSWHVFDKPSLSFFRLFKPSYLKAVFSVSSLAEAIFSIRHHFYFNNYNTKLGWKTLQKYRHYFPNSRFVIIETPLKDRDAVFDLFVIDTIQFKSVVQQHLKEFQDILQNNSLNPDRLLEEIKKRPLFEVLNYNEVLLAILFGFGKGNGAYYEQNQRKGNHCLDPIWDEELIYENLTLKTKKFYALKPCDLSDLYYPAFVAVRDSDETKELVNLYRESKEKILKYYDGKDFVEATLSLLNQKGEVPLDATESTTFWGPTKMNPALKDGE
jgi:hypothetical protein